MTVDLTSTDGLALRAIQMLDEVLSVNWLAENRHHLLAAEDELGVRLGLACTGVRESGDVLSYDHSDSTCPIHEWLCTEDARR